MLLICREFGWTVKEYQDTEAEYIDMILLMLSIEADEREREHRRNNSKIK